MRQLSKVYWIWLLVLPRCKTKHFLVFIMSCQSVHQCCRRTKADCNEAALAKVLTVLNNFMSSAKSWWVTAVLTISVWKRNLLAIGPRHRSKLHIKGITGPALMRFSLATKRTTLKMRWRNWNWKRNATKGGERWIKVWNGVDLSACKRTNYWILIQRHCTNSSEKKTNKKQWWMMWRWMIAKKTIRWNDQPWSIPGIFVQVYSRPGTGWKEEWRRWVNSFM